MPYNFLIIPKNLNNMQAKKYSSLLPILFIGLLSSIMLSCTKEDEKKNLPSLTTNEVINITGNSANSGGNISDDGGTSVTSRGVCWSTFEDPTITDSKTVDGAGGGSFTSTMTDLIPNTIYFLRAYATNKNGTGYGMAMSFKTLTVGPSVATVNVTDITDTSATCGGNILSNGGSNIISCGVCWSISPNPTLENDFTNDGFVTGNYVSIIAGLEPGTTYHVRAYATNNIGIGFGEEITFTTMTGKPIVTTLEVSNITATTASSGGNITNDGGEAIIERGIVWSKSENPTINNNDGITHNGVGIGYFISELTSLEFRTTYYVRAYATNNQGTGYGEQLTFTTNSWEQLTNAPGKSRSHAISFVIDNTAYIGLGNDNNQQDLADIWKYNYQTDSWTYLCDFPGGARSYAFAFVINGKVYIGGGSYGKKDLWEYNPSDNNWQQKGDCPQSTEWDGVGFSIGSKGYILDSQGNLYEYNPVNDSWNNKSSYPGGMNYPVFFVINEKAYVGIGSDTRQIFVYEPSNDTWSYKTVYPGNAWRLTTSIIIGNSAYIVGGWSDNGCVKEVWEYNTINNTFQKLEDFPNNERHSAISFTINNIGYFGTGNTSCGMVSPINDMWKFLP